jgi:HEAT repeat protein
VALLDDPSPRLRTAGVSALANARNPDVAVVLAEAFARDVIPPSSRLAALRRLVATGDARIIRPLLEVLPRITDDRERFTIYIGLEVVVRKLAIADRWFGEWRPPDVRVGDIVDLRALRQRLADPLENPTFRSFLAQLLPRLGVANVAPALWIALGSGDVDLRIAAADGLLRLGQDRHGIDLVDIVMPQIVRASRSAPSLIFEMYRRNPEHVRRRLVRTLRRQGYVYDRIAVAWVAAATGDPALRTELERLVRAESRELRLAGLAGLGRIADPTTRRTITAALGDPDFLVRDFAARALAALPPS